MDGIGIDPSVWNVCAYLCWLSDLLANHLPFAGFIFFDGIE